MLYLNSYAVQLLQKAVLLISQIDHLKSEKIEDQKTVIDFAESVKSSVRE